MATYTIKINEKTQAGKKLVNLLKSLEVVTSMKPAKTNDLDQAIEEMKTGKTTKCKDFNDYLKKIK